MLKMDIKVVLEPHNYKNKEDFAPFFYNNIVNNMYYQLCGKYMGVLTVLHIWIPQDLYLANKALYDNKNAGLFLQAAEFDGVWECTTEIIPENTRKMSLVLKAIDISSAEMDRIVTNKYDVHQIRGTVKNRLIRITMSIPMHKIIKTEKEFGIVCDQYLLAKSNKQLTNHAKKNGTSL